MHCLGERFADYMAYAMPRILSVAIVRCTLGRVLLVSLILQFGLHVSAQSLFDLNAESRAERFVLQNLRQRGSADLSRLPEKQRSIRGTFLQQILFNLPDSQFPARSISLIGATVTGDVSHDESGAVVTRDIEFQACTFENINLSTVTFERSLKFSRHLGSYSKLGNLKLDYAHIKGNLVLFGIVPSGPDMEVKIDLTGARVDGFVSTNVLHLGSIVAPRLSTRVLSVGATANEGGSMDFSNLEAEEIVIGRSGVPALAALSLTNAVAKVTLLVRYSKIHKFMASGLRVGSTTDLEGALIGELDFTASDLGDFTLRVPVCPGSQNLCWPDKTSLGAVSFRELGVGEYSEHQTAGHHFPDVTPDQPQLGLEFLGRALYSEPAYTSFEQSLRSRGLLTEADNAYRAMHGHKRNRIWNESTGVLGKLGAVILVAIDRIQGIFLGYGRSALPPLLWSLAFVIFGTVAFRTEHTMEPVGEHPPRFSPFWYSLELFLPVVDLGVAKSWRPAQRSLPLLTYARVHQLAGWILIPVALAALTGAFK